MDIDLAWQNDQTEVLRTTAGSLSTNVYLVRCRRTGASALVDAAAEGARLVELARQFDVHSVITTHGHWDHIGAVPAMREAGYQVLIGGPDEPMLPGHDGLLHDGDRLSVGDLSLALLATPGHTPGSLCIHVERTPVLLTGDTLFPGGPGATNKAHSDFGEIIESVSRLFDAFDDDTLVLPGHGASTTIGSERPHLAKWIERGW